MASPNSVPRYIHTGRSEVAQVSVANTNRDGTGTIVDVLTAGGQGTRLDLVRIVATGTTTAGLVRLFLNDGSNSRLLAEIPISAVTPSDTVAAFAAEWQPTITTIIPSGWKLQAATEKAETFNVYAFGGDF